MYAGSHYTLIASFTQALCSINQSQEVLAEAIGAENLPVEYGGSCKGDCNPDGKECVPVPNTSDISIE